METPMDLASWRKMYQNNERPNLVESELPSRNPFSLFHDWFRNVAAQQGLSYEECNAVCLSTVSSHMRPSSRMVLLKEFGEHGFSFYTNYDSRKGRELLANPNAAMMFYWPKVHRQVRVEGVVEKLGVEAAEKYWSSRPLGSRISAKASEQSKAIPSRQHLLDRKAELEEAASAEGEAAISKPPNWGGFILRPHYFEFWQGQPDRLHDRIIFDRERPEEGSDLAMEADGGWFIYRLAP